MHAMLSIVDPLVTVHVWSITRNYLPRAVAVNPCRSKVKPKCSQAGLQVSGLWVAFGMKVGGEPAHDLW